MVMLVIMVKLDMWMWFNTILRLYTFLRLLIMMRLQIYVRHDLEIV